MDKILSCEIVGRVDLLLSELISPEFVKSLDKVKANRIINTVNNTRNHSEEDINNMENEIRNTEIDGGSENSIYSRAVAHYIMLVDTSRNSKISDDIYKEMLIQLGLPTKLSKTNKRYKDIFISLKSYLRHWTIVNFIGNNKKFPNICLDKWGLVNSGLVKIKDIQDFIRRNDTINKRR